MSRPRPTAADYLVIALSPALIMVLVGSLVFFLIEVFYQGSYDGRLTFIMAMFVMAAVLIARISIEESREYATLFAIPLAIVTVIATIRFVEFSGPLQSFSTVINIGLIALIWWCTDRLTWDSTVIDESNDASGEGLLQTAGLDADATSSSDQESAAERAAQPPRTTLWQRFVAYRRRNHAPGVWVIYFSIGALPIFGFGNWFVPSEDLSARRYVFKLLVAYVASALGLLLTTSFLNLRRYLRQRRLEMPLDMAGTWIGTGAAMIAALLLVCTLLPRRNPEYALTQLPIFAGSPTDLWTTEWAVGNEGQEDPENGDRSDDQEPQSDDQGKSDSPASGGQSPGDGQQQSDDKSDGGQSSGGKKENGGGQSGGKSKSGREGKSKGGGKSKAKGDSKSGDKSTDGDSQEESDSQGGANSNDGGNSKDKKKQSSGKDMNDQQGKQQKQGGDPEQQDDSSSNQQQQDQQSGDQQSAQQAEKQKSQGKENQVNQNKKAKGGSSEQRQRQPTKKFDPSKIASALGGTLGQLLRFLYWAVAIAITAFVVWKYWRQIREALANFWKSLQEFWARLFGRQIAATVEATAAAEPAPPPIPFSSFHDPFLTGMAERQSPVEVVRYTFSALEAWSRERGVERGPEQTPHEFAQVVGAHLTPVAREASALAELYNRCAYSGIASQRLNLEPLRRLWQQMQ